MFQGRCFQKLDRFLEALSSYTEVLDQPDLSGEFRKLKAEVFVLAAECWSRSTPPLHAEAVNRLAPFVASARPKEDKQPQWLKLRLELAKAQWRRAQDLKQIDAKDSQVKQLEAEARRHFVFVAKEPGELQPQARELLAQAGGTPGAKPDAPSQPTTFGDANRAGREALEAMQTANLILDAVPERLAKEQDLDDVTRADLQKQLQEAQQKSATAIQDAKRHFRQALALAGREAKVEPDELAAIRYYLCYLYYASGEYEEAGLLGDFLARRSPSSPLAPEGAKIALHCFVKLYAENKSEDKSFESKRLTDIASYITQKWPDRPEAIDALNTLIPFVIRDGRLEQAEQYLNAIPPESSKRGDAEIKTGQALWSAYLKGVQEVRGWEADKSTLPEGVDLAAKKQTLEELKTKAQKVLVDGIARMQRGESVSTTLATAALSLAQIYVDTQQIDKAVALLEDEKLGPLPLVKAQHPAADREGFKAEAYKTALRAYLSSLAGAAAPEAVVQKATEVMEALKDSLEEDKLIALYVSLARELEAEMKLATPEAKVTLSQAFEKFLRQIQTGGRAFSVLNWVAETFAGMAESFDTDKANLTDEARQYYTEAAKTYQAILDKVQFGDPRQKTAVRLRQAFVARRLEVFTEAKKTYLEILRANPQTVNVQVEAARMYQEWARFPEKEALYEWAIRGAEPDPKSGRNIIWGWAHLGNQVAPYPKFRDTFFEARYNLSWCRYQWGLGQAKSEQKAFFEKAKQDILRTQQLYGTGREWEAWKPRFDSLLKMLQRQLGEQPVGLPSSSLGAK
jgi:tetratricopeptide (TPR) repeat protein